MSPYRFVILNPKDNVATALDFIPAGSVVKITYQNREQDITIKQPIEFGHKFAIVPIKQGEDVLKYGEVIGVASNDIAEGEHVHVHNVEGKRGRGDRKHGKRSILGV
ncbi:UxaA family hydrolase [Geobacillus sp. G4]|uniref:UxaA family hydrolase n=1 Tax=Geobacillus TaxID=129337 RepID=UPI00078DC4D0|nr:MULTISPECIES: UxaA family hydrolase [Geobacillus]MED0653988.1 UxaA family hydrolase [Anoxybacillus geothermalis]AMQ20758.1 D-galactarate dehydratase [Geobacillus sp. JS12]MCK7606505.1 UxaA family hydrolase [Geobacillus stearothermophilus]PJW15710.1 D-galactarate dehydratase [Geobacillus sp. Manikaran-105]PJW17226.1 D-galactarate dehydratase [Geobacillus sp. WSUCF-018B]